MTGQVERFAEITPARLVLEGRVGEELKQTVTIRPRQSHPFTIKHIRTRHKDLLTVRLDHLHEEPPDGLYQITIESIYNQPGRYVDQVHLQTDNENHPEIRLGVILILNPADAKGGR
jgi:hypothetical protein